MSEKYVREILEKLEEIEKLHAKLRSLVPRVKNYRSENNPNAAKERLMNMENKQSVAKETNGYKKNSREQKPVDFRRGSETLKNTIKDSGTRVKKLFDPNAKCTRYFEKFRDQSKNKLGNFRRNSIDYVTKQWYEKNDQIKYLLSTMIEPDILLASRASQTSDDDLTEIVLEKNSPIVSSKKKKLIKKRRSTVEDLSERLLEHFNYIYDSNYLNDTTISLHDHGLGKNEPHKVSKTISIPDETSETLKIVSSARKVSVNGNRKQSDTSTYKLPGKYTDVRLKH